MGQRSGLSSSQGIVQTDGQSKQLMEIQVLITEGDFLLKFYGKTPAKGCLEEVQSFWAARVQNLIEYTSAVCFPCFMSMNWSPDLSH